MAVTFNSNTSVGSLLSGSSDDDQLSIGVISPNGKPLTPGEVLRQAVMSALGTKDKAQVEEFIKQNNLTPPKEIPTTRQSGQTVYNYPVDEKFYAAAEEFKQKMPPPVTVPRLKQPKYDRNNANVVNGIDRSQIYKQNLNGKLPPKTSGSKQTQTNGQIVFDGQLQVPKQVTENQARAIRRYNADVWQRTREGLDGKSMKIPLSIADLQEIKANTKDGDARLEVMIKGLQSLGYSDQAIKNVLESEKLSTDAASDIHLIGGKDAKTDVNKWLDDTIREWTDRSSINNINNNRNVTWSNVSLDAGLRKKVFIEDLRLRGGDDSVTLYNQKLELQTKIDKISAEYDKKLDKAQNLLETSILVNNRDDQIKSAIDESYAKLNLDLRGDQTNGQQTANQTADTIEKVIRIGLETNPTTKFLPESVKNRIVNAGIGLTNGATYLASAVKGGNDFVKDQAIDALNYGLKQIPNERIQKFAAEFEKSNAALRENRAEWWRSMTDLKTANLSRLDAALDNKIQRNLPLNALDIPSFERSLGKILPQAAIQSGIAVATGGASIGAQIALTAAVNGGMTFGATYATTNDGWKAGKEAAITAAQTAVIPLTSKIPGIGSEVLDLTTGYIVGKMRGQNDVEILDQMLTQGLLGAAFKTGKKFADLTVTERQQAWQRFRQIGYEVSKAVDANYAAAKSKFEIIKASAVEKFAVSDTQAEVARSVIRQNIKNPPLYGSLYMLPIEPKVAKAYVTLARKTLQNGAVNFKDFAGRMTNELGAQVKPYLPELFAGNTDKKTAISNSKEIKVFQTNEAAMRAQFEKIIEFRAQNKIPEYSYPKNANGESTGTVAFSKANGQIEFGTNTTVGAKYLGTNNSELRKQVIADIQTKLGKLESAKYNDRDTKFLTHAEAESLIKLAQKNGGKLPDEVEIYSDRPTCTFCQGNDREQGGYGLSLLAELYGVKKLTVVDSYGTKYIIRPNQKTEVIK